MKKNLLAVVLTALTLLAFSETARADYEPNDTSAQAKTLTTGIYTIRGNGEDWFKVQLNPGVITLTMISLGEYDANMVLYNDDLVVVAANFSSGTETISYTLSASDTYYINVFSAVPGKSSTYDLDISLPEGSWSKKLNFGPARDVSLAVYDIDNDGKDEIFIGTSKALDNRLNEIRPAGLICLEDDGSIKWSVSFPALDGSDSQTGISYNTTSVSTPPVFSDITGDGHIDILVGVGADTFAEAGADVSGQPGDKGGVYALDASGSIIWFHQSLDTIGGTNNQGDGRPDGVYGAPVVFDIDRDGVKEVIFGSWDQSLWILDGPTGTPEVQVHLADTIWSSPCITDVNNDGTFEILISADITTNTDAGTSTGGIFHVISADGSQNIPGFDQPVGNPSYTQLRGKYEEQTLWSSPVAADIDQDGYVEIIYGTGNYFHDTRGSYIKVWEHDGTLKYQLDTQGRTLASPLVVDLDNDGYDDIVAATLDGYIYAWNYLGQQMFAVQPQTYPGTSGQPIFSSPVVADLDGDSRPELIFSQGANLNIIDYTGTQVNSADSMDYIFELFKGSPVVKDIDGDSQLEMISGGNTSDKDQAEVFRWISPLDGSESCTTTWQYQNRQSLHNIQAFTSRFYETVLNRDADAAGLNFWTDSLCTGIRAGADVAFGFVFSQESMDRNLDDTAFINMLYSAFFDRIPGSGEAEGWVTELATGATREGVLNGFIYSQEFNNLCRNYSILPVGQ
ncbi:FG-GAP-like repeat-containing protein [Desulfobacter postgatei]|uniref:FG-GAP-like repeat-containing protein n=1 Tax=Desulfobacter postgatei TaxID=2293 RepID=UPI00259B65D2|nr:FG-GAP-like repeat-containing protein [uncultured Desulfobacter sp.]